ncbi:MAG: hypothetical protein BCV62_16140 [Pseudomonas sp. K35]|nr:MAG: hypothetical protein BCV62_16140 [Pseudomonas sp. K35]
MPLEFVTRLEWSAIRNRRNQLLEATDYTQTLDAPLSDAQRAEGAAYRQALRDVPQDFGDPFKVAWPVKPAFLK